MKIVLLGLIFCSSVFAQSRVPVSWMSCSLEERIPAEERLARIYETKVAAIEIETGVECNITSWTPISAFAHCFIGDKKVMIVRMDVNFYCNSPKTRLRKTVYTHLN